MLYKLNTLDIIEDKLDSSDMGRQIVLVVQMGLVVQKEEERMQGGQMEPAAWGSTPRGRWE